MEYIINIDGPNKPGELSRAMQNGCFYYSGGDLIWKFNSPFDASKTPIFCSCSSSKDALAVMKEFQRLNDINHELVVSAKKALNIIIDEYGQDNEIAFGIIKEMEDAIYETTLS